MEFFNRKEESIHIELTQYGKHLLSQGKFKPFFYSFHDNDVVYDSQYAGFGEPQAAAQDRILETPRIKALTKFEGAETRMKKMVDQKNLEEEKPELYKYTDQSVLQDDSLSFSDYQPTATKYYGLGARLGTSRLLSTHAPSWNISFIDGEILNPNDSIDVYSTASINVEPIPQINIEVKTRTKVIDPSLDSNISPQNLGSVQAASQFSDGTSLDVTSDPLLIDIQENNAESIKPRFDVEVFEIETDEKDNEFLRPLRFNTRTILDDNGYVVSMDNIANANEDKKYAEYYLDLSLDGQVQRPNQVPLPKPKSTPDFTLPFSPLSEIPVNDFLCPDEITTEDQLSDAYGQSDTSGVTSAISVSNEDDTNNDFDNTSGAGNIGGSGFNNTGGGGSGGGGGSTPY